MLEIMMIWIVMTIDDHDNDGDKDDDDLNDPWEQEFLTTLIIASN